MSHIAIAGNFPIPEGLTVGQTITVTARLTIDSLSQDRIDVTGIGREPESLLGEITLNTYAESCEVTA